jgi:hypothetical protein
MTNKDLEKKLKSLQDVINIQLQDGNWNYDPYMMGLANGLLMAESCFTGKEPKFLNAPNKWLKDYPKFWTKIKWMLFGTRNQLQQIRKL